MIAYNKKEKKHYKNREQTKKALDKIPWLFIIFFLPFKKSSYDESRYLN